MNTSIVVLNRSCERFIENQFRYIKTTNPLELIERRHLLECLHETLHTIACDGRDDLSNDRNNLWGALRYYWERCLNAGAPLEIVKQAMSKTGAGPRALAKVEAYHCHAKIG